MLIISSLDRPAEFAAWAILRCTKNPSNRPYSEQEFVQRLTEAGVPYTDPASVDPSIPKTSLGKELEVGELVFVDGTNCANEANKVNCAELNKQVLIISKIDKTPTSCIISVRKMSRFGNPYGPRYAFSGARDNSAKAGKETGLYRYAKTREEGVAVRQTIQTSAPAVIEFVYSSKKGNAPQPQYRKEMSEAFARKALADSIRKSGDLSIETIVDNVSEFSYNYNKGICVGFTKNKKGEVYAKFKLATRTFSRGEQGAWYTVNVNVGDLYYIGIESQRPSNWRTELLNMILPSGITPATPTRSRAKTPLSQIPTPRGRKPAIPTPVAPAPRGRRPGVVPRQKIQETPFVPKAQSKKQQEDIEYVFTPAKALIKKYNLDPNIEYVFTPEKPRRKGK